MTITMFTPAALALAGLAGLVGLHHGGPDEPTPSDDDRVEELAVVTTTTEPDRDDLSVVAAAPCTALDPDLLDVHVLGSGAIRFVYADDEMATR